MNMHYESPMNLPRKLGLSPSPTGNGWFKLIHHQMDDRCCNCAKSCKQICASSFMYLIDSYSKELWHKFQSSTAWSFLGGAPLLLQTGTTKKIKSGVILGSDFSSQNQPMSLVCANQWQRLSTTGDWSLVSCTYSPGFELNDVEIAVEGWTPGQGEPALSFPGEIWQPLSSSGNQRAR